MPGYSGDDTRYPGDDARYPGDDARYRGDDARYRGDDARVPPTWRPGTEDKRRGRPLARPGNRPFAAPDEDDAAVTPIPEDRREDAAACTKNEAARHDDGAPRVARDAACTEDEVLRAEDAAPCDQERGRRVPDEPRHVEDAGLRADDGRLRREDGARPCEDEPTGRTGENVKQAQPSSPTTSSTATRRRPTPMGTSGCRCTTTGGGSFRVATSTREGLLAGADEDLSKGLASLAETRTRSAKRIRCPAPS